MENGQTEPLKEIDLSKVKYVISDWDGTFVDSQEPYSDAFGRMMNQNFQVDFKKAKDYYIETFGMTLVDQVRGAAQKFANKTVVDTSPFENIFWDSQLESGYPAQEIGGARQTLQYLKENGYTVIIWSGSRTDFLGKKLEETGFSKFVDFYIGNQPGSETLVKGPGLFREIAKHFQVTEEQLRDQSVALGDAQSDIEAGKSCNIPSIGVVKTTTAENLKKLGADYVIEQIGDLSSLLK